MKDADQDYIYPALWDLRLSRDVNVAVLIINR